MFTVLLLAGVEKIINLSLATDPITQHNLQQLNGKTLRIIIRKFWLKNRRLADDRFKTNAFVIEQYVHF